MNWYLASHRRSHRVPALPDERKSPGPSKEQRQDMQVAERMKNASISSWIGDMPIDCHPPTQLRYGELMVTEPGETSR